MLAAVFCFIRGLERFLAHSEYWNIWLLFNNIIVMCIHVCHGTHAEARGSLLRVSSLLLCGFCHRTQVIRPGGKHIYVLSHLTSFRMVCKCFASLPHSIFSMF